MAEQRPSLAGSGRCRQGRAPPRNSRQDNVRNRLLSAQRAFDARTLQRSRSLALGRRKSAALAARCRHERGSGSQSFGKRPPQSRRSPPHGLERHAKGWGKRLAPGQVQASRLGRTLPCPTPNPVLKCDRPALDAEPHVALAANRAMMGDFAQSEAEVERGLRLNPSSADIMMKAALSLAALGQPERGADLCDRAFRLNAMPVVWYAIHCVDSYYFVGRYADAIDMVRRTH